MVLINYWAYLNHISIMFISFINSLKRMIGDHSSETELQIKEVLDKHGDYLYKLAFSYVHNYEDSEEIVEDVLLKYLEKAPLFNDEEHQKAWLINVCANISKNKIKYNQVRSADDIDDHLELGCEDKDLAFVLDALKELEPNQSEVLHLFYYEGYSTSEIAKILKRKEATVRSDLHRARLALKEKLKEDYDFE